jgi:hypothetical protein
MHEIYESLKIIPYEKGSPFSNSMSLNNARIFAAAKGVAGDSLKGVYGVTASILTNSSNS